MDRLGPDFALTDQSDLDDSELDHFPPTFFPKGSTVRFYVRAPGAMSSRSVDPHLLTAEERRRRLGETPAPRNLDEAVTLALRPERSAVFGVDA
mgnify:CR=1 FL=1